MTLQVAMTYSVELFICMIIGLVLGHAIFNTGDEFFRLNEVFKPIIFRSCCGGERGPVLRLPGSHT